RVADSVSLGGTVSGSLLLVVESTATGVVSGGAVDGATIRNEGSLTQSGATMLVGRNGAEFDNIGTFAMNATCSGCSFTPGLTVSGSGAAPRFVNSGTFVHSAVGNAASVQWNFDNDGDVSVAGNDVSFTHGVDGETSTGSWSGSDGGHPVFAGPFSLGADTEFDGDIKVNGSAGTTVVSAASVQGADADVQVMSGSLMLADTDAVSHLDSLEVSGSVGTVGGSGTLRVADSVSLGGTVSGSLLLVVESTATGVVGGGAVDGATIRNEGSLTQSGATMLVGRNGAEFDNIGTFSLNASCSGCSFSPGLTNGVGTVPLFRNSGILQRTAGSGEGSVFWSYENTGTIREVSGPIHFFGTPVSFAPPTEEAYGPSNAATPSIQRSCSGKPVDCATGNQYETQPDLAVGGRVLSLGLTRTYNSQLAEQQSARGTFGYGWTGTYDDHLVIDTVQRHATVFQADGSQVQFLLADDGTISAPAWVQATLVKHGDGTYTYTLPSQQAFTFASGGRLTSEADRNGNALTMTYDGGGRLATVTDSAGRSLTYTHNGDGMVASVTDPAGLEVDYGYDDGELTGVHYDGISAAQWAFDYDGEHQLTSMTDARGHTSTTDYDGQHRVTSQADALARTRTWSYGTDETTITNPGGDVTHETFEHGMPLTITRAQGTSAETTQTLTYNSSLALASSTDGNGHTTTYGYDSAGNRTSVVAPGTRTTSMTYDTHRDVTSITTPTGRTTTFVYDTHGNLTSETRTLHSDSGDVAQTTTYVYDAAGNLTSITDPLHHETVLTYGTRGDLQTSTDPLGHETSWTYDDDSRSTSATSPRGHEDGADPEDFTTTFSRDALGRLTETTDGQGRHTSSSYDALGNVTSDTDGEGRTTGYTYDAENQPTSTTQPGDATSSTTYDDNGQVTGTTDENGHTTTYTLNPASEVTAVTDPDDRTSTYTYDDAGQRIGQTDPDGRTIAYDYDAVGALTGVDYQDSGTHDLGFAYDDDGQRTSMTDATGTTSYDYDSLGRLTSTTDGNGKTIGYDYDLGDRQTALTYPAGDQVSRTYDAADQLASVTDWLDNATAYDHDADGDLTTITYPDATQDVDHWSYDHVGNPTSIEFAHDGTARGGLTSTYNDADQVTGDTPSGAITGAHSYDYDPRGRLDTQDTTDLGYDPASNLSAIGPATQSYDDADQLTHGTDTAGTTDYDYDPDGNRTSATPPSGPATTYGYDQADRMTGVDDGTDPAITYTYDADGLRASQTKSATTTHFTWDRSTTTPNLLANGSDRYVYDNEGLPLEQINDTGDVTYLHHDRLGSTRLTTTDDGTLGATYDYDATGQRTTTSGTTDTPFGYTGQYTDPDTGLIYLRARYYDPTTGQFLTRDPLEDLTRQPYGYAGGDPANNVDPNGLCSINPFSGDSCAGNVAAGILDGLTGGLSTKFAGSVLGFDADCTSFGGEFGVGHNLGVVGGLFGGGGELFGAERGVAGVITGYTKHGLAQAIARDEGRGVAPAAILDAVRSPLSKTVQKNGTILYQGKDAAVVVNTDGRVVTTWSKNSSGVRR
ncbi:MAG: Rhs family protein, partial [Conexibacter sp.]|nr:Rhs family protein [Conexibacter sp.]